MDLNPKWFVPRSIILKDMAHHAGNVGYFKSRNYYISDRSTGKEVDPAMVTRSMLVSGKYGVVQRGGKGNALGRIIFRFDNNFLYICMIHPAEACLRRKIVACRMGA